MITEDRTWRDFEISKLHSRFLRPKSQRNPQGLLQFACQDLEVGKGGLFGETNTFAEKFCLMRRNWLDAGDFRFFFFAVLRMSPAQCEELTGMQVNAVKEIKIKLHE